MDPVRSADPLDRAIIAGAARALRSRAARQRERASAWTVMTADSRGQPVPILTGEAAIFVRIAEVLEATAQDLARDLCHDLRGTKGS